MSKLVLSFNPQHSGTTLPESASAADSPEGTVLQEEGAAAWTTNVKESNKAKGRYLESI